MRDPIFSKTSKSGRKGKTTSPRPQLDATHNRRLLTVVGVGSGHYIAIGRIFHGGVKTGDMILAEWDDETKTVRLRKYVDGVTTQ